MTSSDFLNKSKNRMKNSPTCGSLFAECNCNKRNGTSVVDHFSDCQRFERERNLFDSSRKRLSAEQPRTREPEPVIRSKSLELDKPASKTISEYSIDLSDLNSIKIGKDSICNDPWSSHNVRGTKKKDKKNLQNYLTGDFLRKKSNQTVAVQTDARDQKRLFYQTLDTIYSAKICLDNPELCLKHPDFPYPIPPKLTGQAVKSGQKSERDSASESKKYANEYFDVDVSEDPNGLNEERLKVVDQQLDRSGSSQRTGDVVDGDDDVIGSERRSKSSSARSDDSYLSKDSFIRSILTMGNGSFSSLGNRRTSKNDGQQIVDKKQSSEEDNFDYLRTTIPRLRKGLIESHEKNQVLETEVYQLRKKLQNRDAEITKLKREAHKLKSVLQLTSCAQDNDILASLQEHHGMANRMSYAQIGTGTTSVPSTPGTNAVINKKQGVSAESSGSNPPASAQSLTVRYNKDFRSKQLIKDAIMDNSFLKNLDSYQVRELVDSMYSKEYKAGSYVINEGEAGAHLFVSAEGEFEVIKDNDVLGKMGPGRAFGELAILYNCTRTASIRVVVDSKVWVLDRRVFQQIMRRTGLQRMQDNINFLRSVPLLSNLSDDILTKIADVLEVEFYAADAYIIRQGASGDTFFIISSGYVKVTQKFPHSHDEEVIRILKRGDYFGEQALLKEDFRTASVRALYPGVECLTLDRDSFIQLIGDLSEFQEKDYGDEQRAAARPLSYSTSAETEFDYIELNDLDVIATLGVGGFGRVELVQHAHNTALTFALKCLKKQHIVDTQQQEHVYSEKRIMMMCRHPFICRLYKTFKDSKYVYMLLEACLGGEVWTILRDRGCFDDHTTRFITACVIEAFDYLHAQNIIYRDLKPENLLLDQRGYVKIVDFGFSKKLNASSKTWTFCGTPEYVAPETILNKGHDRAVDYWALGILMHELLTGTPPFHASDPMKTYNLILKGIDMVYLPNHITKTAQNLIKRLCRELPSERLGYQKGGVQDIKKHKWFQGFDWDGLRNGTVEPPIVQAVRGPCDTTNFDRFSKDADIPPDELSSWDADF